MRRAARIDDNQPIIVGALRELGASVTAAHGVGGGFPDLVVGYRGKTFLLEIKDGSKPPSAQKLTPDQVSWHSDWRGHVAVVSDIKQALEAVGIPYRGAVS